MPRRISIAGLLGIVAVVGLGLAALRVASPVWTGAIAVLTMALWLTALLGLISLRGPTRAFCVGFLLWCWASLLLDALPWFGEPAGPHLRTLSAEIASRAHPMPAEIPSIGGPFAHVSLGILTDFGGMPGAGYGAPGGYGGMPGAADYGAPGGSGVMMPIDTSKRQGQEALRLYQEREARVRGADQIARRLLALLLGLIGGLIGRAFALQTAGAGREET
ncbi:MAG: hypothetical protein IRY99_21525 [Isosphaeraceae bacterium]|nr:hypothetical protein [Isosphaeraceae bacterium]